MRKKRERRETSKDRRRVCLLSARGGRELEMWGQGQPCFGPGCMHTHITRQQAEEMERGGIVRFVGKGRNVATYSYGRTWKGVPSGASRAKVMQLV